VAWWRPTSPLSGDAGNEEAEIDRLAAADREDREEF
jgi:hypothetical protein